MSDQISQADNQGFSESCLSLREPADHAARSAALSRKMVDALHEKPKNIVELGAGTGSNLRYLMPMLGHDQSWLLADNDAKLLDHLPRILQPWLSARQAKVEIVNGTLQVAHDNFSATIKTQVVNLATHLNDLCFDNASLVTASALLDLTSAQWLDNLAAKITSHQCASLFVLNYNGQIQWQPEIPEDKVVSALLNEHQLKDKGFGQALGPGAGQYFADQLAQLGNKVLTEQSDWQIQAQSQDLQLAIVDGWAPAAIDQDATSADTVELWHQAKLQAIKNQHSELRVGHLDVLSVS